MHITSKSIIFLQLLACYKAKKGQESLYSMVLRTTGLLEYGVQNIEGQKSEKNGFIQDD
jgi:hypothetical protein